jgi:dihydrofolate reductase
MIQAIVALDLQNGLAKNGSIPWKSKQDMQFFKNITQDSIVVMGIKTFLSLPKQKPLPNRENIVITNKINFYSPLHEFPNLQFVSMEEVKSIILCSSKRVFIIGGNQIYNSLLPFCSSVFITRIQQDYECDLFFTADLTHFSEIIKVYNDEEIEIVNACRPGAINE